MENDGIEAAANSQAGVDVIVVNYRGADRVARSIPEVLRFLGPHASATIVNNSPEQRDDLRSIPDVARVIESGGNIGFAAAVNLGVASTHREFILLANPDLAEIRGQVHWATDEFRIDSRVGAVAVRLLHSDGTLQPSCRVQPTFLDFILQQANMADKLPRWERANRFRQTHWDHLTRRVVDAATGAFLFLRRTALETVGGFDERFFMYWEETDWLVRAKSEGWRTVFVPNITVQHAGGGSTSVDRSVLDLLLLESELVYVQKHLGRQSNVIRVSGAAMDSMRLLKAVLPPCSTNAPGARRSEVHNRLRLYRDPAVLPISFDRITSSERVN